MAAIFCCSAALYLPTRSFIPSHPPVRSIKLSQFRLNHPKLLAKAVREWRDYEEAVKSKDLSRALRFLKSIEDLPGQSTESSTSLLDGRTAANSGSIERMYGWERNWEVLDTCLNADDMRLVGGAYVFLKGKGFLPSFGKCRNIVLEGPREITPSVIKTSTGLEVSKLAPKKWGVSGASRAVLVALIGGVSFLLSQGIDVRPNLAAVSSLALLDSIFLGGCCLAQISSYWPPYRRRILIHEAGHLLTAYLMGCPIRGVILDPIVAMQMGIQGQAGTQFWDKNLEEELAGGRLSSTAFDRFI